MKHPPTLLQVITAYDTYNLIQAISDKEIHLKWVSVMSRGGWREFYNWYLLTAEGLLVASVSEMSETEWLWSVSISYMTPTSPIPETIKNGSTAPTEQEAIKTVEDILQYCSPIFLIIR